MDLMRQGLPFCIGDDIYYPISEDYVYLEADLYGSYISVHKYGFDQCNITYLYDYFEGVPEAFTSSEIKACTCDFHSVIMPYGCQCGGK